MRKTDSIAKALRNWYSQSARDLPWRRTADPYAIWVSEIMLQQTQVKTVIPYWNRWMQELPTIAAAANASSDKLHKLWEGLGYYTRVRNLQKAAQVIVSRHGGKFPESFEAMLELPGIGRYTAGAICSIAFNQPVPLLDGNVIRVLTRIFGIADNPKEKETNARLWHLAEDLVKTASRTDAGSSPACSHLNQSLMELGALVCTPRNAQCLLCPVNKLCVACQEGRVEELPNLGKREKATTRRFLAFILGHDGKFLVRQRPAGVVNAHLWEFPNVEITDGHLGDDPSPPLKSTSSHSTTTGGANSNLPSERGLQPASTSKLQDAMNRHKSRALETKILSHAFKSAFGFTAPDLSSLCTVKHSITRYRITVDAFAAALEKVPARVNGQAGVWKTPAQMRKLAFTAAHKKLATAAVQSILSGR